MAVVEQMVRKGDITAAEGQAQRAIVHDRYSTADQRTKRATPSQWHEVESGQLVGGIAKLHGLRQDDVERANPDLKSADDIRPGQFLKLPTADEVKTWDDERKKKEEEAAKAKGAKKADAEDSPWSKVAGVVHDIGDTAGALASDIFGIHSAAAAEPPHPLGPPALPQTVDDAAAKAAESPPADPRVAQMQEMAATPVTNKGQSAMLKKTETLTQPEMMDLIHHAQGDYRGWRSGDPLKAHAYEKVQDWHVGIYGDGPQANDGGKPIEPQPIRPIPEKPSPHTTPQGEDPWQATARLGPAKVEDGLALGRFNTFARQAQASGNPDGLEAKTHDIFGSLLRAPSDTKAPKVEAGVLQETLNDVGSQHHDDWQPLKVDNWIGPKTTAAFGSVLKTEDADSLTSAFGRSLGLL